MLTAAVIVPLVGAAAILALPRAPAAALRAAATAVGAVPLVLAAFSWARFDITSSAQFQQVERIEWIPGLGASWAVGVDGISLALVTMTALVLTAAVAYPVDTRGRPRQYYAWLLFLEATSLGLFLALDLLVFYVFFDLSLVGMYFLIGRWGHGDSARSALTFFLFTLAGSLVLLLGIIALYLGIEPHTFDMAAIIAAQPHAAGGATGALVLWALLAGLAVKTPLVPVHTWLPPAHVDAPGPASAVLAGVLLKMGVYGMIRLPLSMLREPFRQSAPVLAGLAVVSVVYGALVALGQTNLKRRIAYTSINHMGYAVLGVAAAAALAGGGAGAEDARRLALAGTTFELVAHGLITGSLFLIAGSFWQRTQDYDLDAYGGLAGRAPALTAATLLASFASLGLPGLAGFAAEIQIFLGTFAVYPVAAGLALVGVLVTAALLLQMTQKLFFGELPDHLEGFADLGRTEVAVLAAMLALVVALGVLPAELVEVLRTAPSSMPASGR